MGGEDVVRVPVVVRAGPVIPHCGAWIGVAGRDLDVAQVRPQHPVGVLFAGVGDVRGGGLEDPRAGQPGHGHQGEVARIGGLAGRGEQGHGLRVGEPGVGDPAGTAGRWTCSAGDCARVPTVENRQHER